jgi:flagellar motor switch protein FliM
MQTKSIEAENTASSNVQRFEFGRLNGIPNSQLRAVQLVHENFARSLSSSLSAYLRSFVVASLATVEHISYSEFLARLSTPTCLAYMALTPYESTAVFELNIDVMFAFFELLLGGKVESSASPKREFTEIEKSVLQSLMPVIFRNLSEAWKDVAEVEFHLQSLSSEPQLLHVIAPAEPVLVVSVDIRVEGKSGVMHLAIPSIFIKRLRTKFESLQQAPKAESKEQDRVRIARLLKTATVSFEATLTAGNIPTGDLAMLKPGDVVLLGHAEQAPIAATINGVPIFEGKIGAASDKLVFQITGRALGADAMPPAS